jgi:hypothetical protein
MLPVDIMPAIWGFLVGFIGWEACFRLIGPVALWVMPVNDGKIQILVHVIVAVFSIFCVLFMLAFMPVFLAAAGTIETKDEWRHIFGVTFISSLAGFFFLGFLRKILRKT